MAPTPAAQPLVLIAATREHALGGVVDTRRYAAVVQVPSAAQALEWARRLRPDAILLDAELPDMAGIEACRQLHADTGIGHNVPILILAADRPTPEQRVSALHAGAWDFLSFQESPDDFSLKLRAYVQAKRNIDVAFADTLVNPVAGLHSRPGLARRARELGALMARMHGALACVVFTLEADHVDPQTGGLILGAARISDVVGVLGPSEFAVLAPATDDVGAVHLARRVRGALSQGRGGEKPGGGAASLQVGYDAIANLTYSPADPVELLSRAGAAVRTGKPEPEAPWVRRYAEPGASPARATPPGLVLDKRRS